MRSRPIFAWLARAVAAALLVATIETALVLVVSPVAVTSPALALGVLVVAAAALLVPAALLALLVALVLRKVPRPRAPEPAANLTVALFVVLATAGIRALHRHVASLDLEFAEPVEAPCPGQTAVLYRGEVVLGSGVIQTPSDSATE